MITSLTTKNPKDLPLSWASKVFKKGQTFTFTPGLNILYGPNGSGKTTLLELLKFFMFASAGNRTLVTESALRSWDPIKMSKAGRLESNTKKITASVDLKHDGQALYVVNPGAGIKEGHFEDGFELPGLLSRLDKGSDGQNQYKALGNLVHTIEKLGGNVEDMFFSRLKVSNDHWRQLHKDATWTLTHPTLEKGRITILADEPSKHLDVKAQIEFWEILAGMAAKDFQIIVATHDILPLFLPPGEVNFIDMKKGYTALIHKWFKELQTWGRSA